MITLNGCQISLPLFMKKIVNIKAKPNMSLPGREGREGRQGHERGRRSQPVRKPEKNKLTLLPFFLEIS